ncbi:hypothetical protein F4553_000639 [Allocatelliglobosispora scoriae]|uniref:Uncharacterized protein n=1 Tax=Allocatelliglobosispora scoriae TaxID=643052 RepID=A0A841BKC2_9ACTN|nr:hypothetical protein [Allocatelliglobosispora scoriae]MBB5867260.1 hypothetical protein [Allocatelliglobosispora scoriae]
MRLLRVLAVAALIVAAAPAPAHALPPTAAGFAYANQPSNPNYILATGYEYNSVNLAVQVLRPAVGTYRVKFLGMGTLGGVPHVSARGSSSLCTVAWWGMAGGDQAVDVRCYDNAGLLADSRFVVDFTNRTPAVSGFGYLWNDNPVPPAIGHTPAPAYSYDSAGLPIKVFRSAVGRYRVELGAFRNDSPGPWAAGYLRITPYAAAARHCQALDPALVPDPQLIEVRCYDDTGSAVDSRFILTYARGAAMLGGSGARTTATVDLSAALPVMRGWTNSYGGAPTASMIIPGTYLIRIPNAAHPKGHAIASIMGTPPMFCTVQWWGPSGLDELVQVSCYDGDDGVPNPAVLLNIAFIA